MSAYGHQMEREYSSQSLSRGGSELGSHYMVESGFYMKSFAATIFIGGLVTVGVLCITLLISLTVMLQSCENRSKGVVEIQTPIIDYDDCKIFALYAELNNLGSDDLPSACKNNAFQNTKHSQYERDMHGTISLVEKYFNGIVPLKDGLDVVLMDLDDLLPSNPDNEYPLAYRSNQHGCSGCLDKTKLLRQRLMLKLYMQLQSQGWSLMLLSRKPERLRNATTQHLLSSGYRGWSSVFMRLEDEMEIDSQEYFLKRRMVIQREGFRIAGIISSQMDALTGPFSGEQIFKLPNPTYYGIIYPSQTDQE